MNIAVIVVTYNAMKWADKCFSSLRNSSVPLEIYVCDNNSTDGTVEYIKNNYPEIHLTESLENLGFGKANNLLIEQAYKNGADFFYLLNQDAWVFPNTIQQILQNYNNYENKHEIGIISPLQIDGSGNYLDIFMDKYIASNFQNRMISDSLLGFLKPWYEIDFVNAAHWFLPKATIEDVGGFNPYFFHYGEDNEYVNRLHFHNKKILLMPHIKAIHDGVQKLKKVDYSKYDSKFLEIKILNPNEDVLKQILNLLRVRFLKNLSLGEFSKAKKSYKRYKLIKKESTLLRKLRKKVMEKDPSFLNLE